MTKKLPPVHPGEILREEFLLPMNLSPTRSPQPAACREPASSA